MFKMFSLIVNQMWVTFFLHGYPALLNTECSIYFKTEGRNKDSSSESWNHT